MSIESPIFGTSKEERTNSFFMLMKDPEVQPIFKEYLKERIKTQLPYRSEKLTTGLIRRV
jgi:hypothetical protein